MEFILNFYITFVPVIFAAIFNMVMVKLPIFQYLKKPMDFKIILRDGRRLFGKNKTWKGCFFMILLSIIFMNIWGSVCQDNIFLKNHNLFYNSYQNVFLYNVIIGAMLGIAYIIFELPNSFMKRRIGIKERKICKRYNWCNMYCNRSN